MSTITENRLVAVSVSSLGYYFLQRSLRSIFPDSNLKRFSDDDKRVDEYRERVLSFVNCLICTFCVLIFYGGVLWDNLYDLEPVFNRPLTVSGAVVLALLYGYMIVDTVWCYRSGYHEIPTILHHVATIYYCHTQLRDNDTEVEAMLGLLFSEVTNIFLNMAWFSEFKKKDSAIWKYLFMITFIGFRFLGGWWISYWYYRVSGPAPIRITCAALNIINMVFAIEIFSKAKEHFTGQVRLKSKSI